MSKKSPTNQLTSQILDYLYGQGAFCWRSNVVGIPIAGTNRMRPGSKLGVPDILGCFKGNTCPVAHFLAVEIKSGSDKLRSEQIGFIKSVEHVGGIALVVHNFDDFLIKWQNATYGIRKIT